MSPDTIAGLSPVTLPALNIRARERRVSPASGADWFVTPASVTQALLDREVFTPTVWEPACGDGAMVRVIEKAGYRCVATDLYDRGCGAGIADFMAADALLADSVIFNPPFKLAGQFVIKALDLGARKVAMLGRIAFLEGGGRHASLFKDRPPCRIWAFSHRQTMWAGGVDRPPGSNGGAIAFAWFVWEKGHAGTQTGWIA